MLRRAASQVCASQTFNHHNPRPQQPGFAETPPDILTGDRDLRHLGVPPYGSHHATPCARHRPPRSVIFERQTRGHQCHTLYDLIEEASSVLVAAKWMTAMLTEAAENKTARTDSSLSDHSVGRACPRRREEPSNRYHNSKRVIFSGTSDGETSRPSSQRTPRPKPGKRLRP